ncbi:MAG: sulfatase-like hydrolase/transferase [Burkholderiales bacterium]
MKKHLPLFLIPFLVFFPLFYGILAHLQISLLHVEVGLVSGGVFLLCALLGGLLVVAPEKLRVALLAALTFIVVDIAVGGYKRMDFIATLLGDGKAENLARLGMMALVIALLYVFLWKIRKHVTQILATAFAVMLVATLVVTPPPLDIEKSTVNVVERDAKIQGANLPIWIHLMLDEMTAPEAINRDLPEGRKLYERMRVLVPAHGFRLYGHTFSKHPGTVSSMSATMNFDSISLDPMTKYTIPDARPVALNSNAYFQQLAGAGYRIRVYQTRYLDFCKSEHIANCETLNSFSPVSRFVSYPENNVLRRTLNVLAMTLTGYPESSVSRSAGYLLPLLAGEGTWYDAEAFPLWFARIKNEILQAPRGTMVFAHVLVPHAPFVWNEECEQNEREPLHYADRREPRTWDNWPAFEIAHQKHYYEQSLCVVRQLDALLSALDASGRFHDAILILHGDHGSRISRSKFSEHMSEEDFVANHAALFAIRKDGVAPGYDLELVSVQDLFARYVAGNSGNVRRSTVVVKSARTGAHEEFAMPGFAAQPGPLNADFTHLPRRLRDDPRALR